MRVSNSTIENGPNAGTGFTGRDAGEFNLVSTKARKAAKYVKSIPPSWPSEQIAQGYKTFSSSLLIPCLDSLFIALFKELKNPVKVNNRRWIREVTFLNSLKYIVTTRTGNLRVEKMTGWHDSTEASFLVAPDDIVVDPPATFHEHLLEAIVAPWYSTIYRCLHDEETIHEFEALIFDIYNAIEKLILKHTHWRSIRHALRAAIALDTKLLHWVRVGVHRENRALVRLKQFNDAIERRYGYEQLTLEAPQLTWLYNLIINSASDFELRYPASEYHGCGIVWNLRTTVLAIPNVTPLAWRYLIQCNHRHFAGLIDFYEYDGGHQGAYAELRCLMPMITALQLKKPLEAEVLNLLVHDKFQYFPQTKMIQFRKTLISVQMMKIILEEAQKSHALGELDEFKTGPLVTLMTWLKEARPVLDANQIRRRWDYLMKRAQKWKKELRAEQLLTKIYWPCLLPTQTFGHLKAVPITDAWSLRQEALMLRNCSDSYLEECRNNKLRLFTVWNAKSRRVGMIGIGQKESGWRIYDVRGFANQPAGFLNNLAEKLLWQYQQAQQRQDALSDKDMVH